MSGLLFCKPCREVHQVDCSVRVCGGAAAPESLSLPSPPAAGGEGELESRTVAGGSKTNCGRRP